MKSNIRDKQFVYFLHQTSEISLGISIDFKSPNLEIHLPFCFIKIGWQGIHTNWKPKIWGKIYI